MPNRLINETSPYLLQHAQNPVDWYPWGPEALQKARAEDKPIFLSIGYAACHWCHVMEHESFEDAETARLLNEHFVPIKVDREERPDLDSIYMQAVVAMTGHGGWPMSIFLTPEGAPFYGGTYYPNVRRYGMPAFVDVLHGILEAWLNRRAEILDSGSQIVAALAQSDLTRLGPGNELLERRTLDEAVGNIHRAFDWTSGGWGGAPKFPQPMTLEFLIRRYVATRDPSGLTLRMITRTLDKMARGGMYDQLGGGFHRYATDAIWLVPHFERMLYDNAQLARVYLHAWQVTHNEFYRRIAEQILDYVAREMTDPHGGFYSSQDADSEGVEGKFFVWTPEEIRNVLGADAQLLIDRYGVKTRGNFEGRNILHVARDFDVLAAMHQVSEAEIEQRVGAARKKLFAAREQRVHPARDEKVLAAWNGLALAAFAEAARAFQRDDPKGLDYRALAERNADFLLTELRDHPERSPAESKGGRLRRSWKEGEARVGGFLEDYANLIEGLLALYQTTFNERWFVAARELANTMLDHFTNPSGGFFDTSDEAEQLVTRPQDLQDNATPSGNAMAATVLLKLGAYTGEGRYTEQAERGLRLVQKALAAAPTGFAQWLSALDFALGQPREIAIVGEGEEERRLVEEVFREYRPNQVVALAGPGEPSAIPLLEGRVLLDGHAAAYVCRNFVCQLPVSQPEALAAQLNTP
jgi:uncharacterized protein